MKCKPLAAALLLLALGCTRLTADNYAKIRMGMSFEEVKSLLGSPDRCNDVLGVKACVWGNDRRSVSVNFVADKAVLFTAQNLR